MTDLPPGAQQVTTEQLLAIIGELYVQTRILQSRLQQAEIIRQDTLDSILNNTVAKG